MKTPTQIAEEFKHTCPKCGSSAFEVNDLKSAIEEAAKAAYIKGYNDCDCELNGRAAQGSDEAHRIKAEDTPA